MKDCLWPTLLLSLLLFGLIAFFKTGFKRLDLSIRRLVRQKSPSGLTSFFLMIQYLNHFFVHFIVVSALSLLLYAGYKDQRRAAVLFVVAAGQMAVIGLVKRWTSYARPSAGSSVKNDSFPSGHSATSFLLFLLIPVILGPYLTDSTAVILKILLLCNALAVSLSRLYLDLHWFSDLAGGWLIGAAAYLSALLLL